MKRKATVLPLFLLAAALAARGEDYAFPAVEASGWTAAPAVRVDARETLGGRLVHGVEQRGEPDGSTNRLWDTTALADGWHEIESAAEDGRPPETLEMLSLNSPSIAIEGGRLAADAVWTSNATHVVRHWVVVPSGRTLVITTNSVTKLCPGAGIKVEDGGTLRFAGAEGAEAVVTTWDDDTVGAVVGGSGAEPPSLAGPIGGVVKQPGSATVSDDTHVRFAFSSDLFPTVSVQDASAKRSDGVARIPVTVSGTARDTAFRVDWRAVDGSAKFGEDYLLASGTLQWSKSSDGTKHVEIPLDPETLRGSNTAFRVELTSHYACNVSRASAEVVVREFDFPEIAGSGWSGSAAIRFDGRKGIAGAVAHGLERLGEPDGSTNRLWDTAQWADGWHEVESVAGDGDPPTTNRVLTLNAPQIAVEGGRLSSSAVWTSNATHLVRHTVVVPNGITLTIAEGAVVKFLPGTYIKVEDGGTLSVLGAAGDDAIFTSVADDRFGLPFDCGEFLDFDVHPTNGIGGIVLQSSAATFQDNAHLQIHSFCFGAYPTVKLDDTVAFRAGGMAYVPVSIASGTRNQAFSIDWEAVDGTARFGEDYTLASGTIEWTGTSQGTKTLQIPLVADHVVGETTSFKLRIKVCRGCNPSGAGECTVTIRELDKIAFATATATSAPVRFDGRESLGGRIVHGVETRGEPDGSAATAWNTTALADGWHEIGAGGETAELLSINAPAIAVEGGRLASNATWDATQTHLVRHWVVVPNGTTLTLERGTVVKFCPDAGIKVEDGGSLAILGADGDDVIFTTVDDDTAGAVIGGSGAEPPSLASGATPRIALQSSSAVFSDNGWFQLRGVSCNASNIGTLSIHDAEVSRKTGMAYVGVTVSGNTRNQSFTADWEAVPGTATFGNDFKLASGRLTWSKSSEGTKWIQIPINKKTEAGARRTFRVRLKTVRGMTGSGAEATVEVREYNEGALDADEVAFFPEGEGSNEFSVDEPVWKEPIFRHETEPIRLSGAWQGLVDPAETTVRLSWEGENGSGVLAEVPGGEPAAYEWRAEDWEVGSYVLKHDILDAASGRRLATYEKTFAVPSWEGVELHGGTLTSNETWRAGIVHVVYETVYVPALYTILLEPGAIVKFLTGTGITIEPGGGALFANGVVFTHINDDTVGGDTLNDGNTLVPVEDAYEFKGELTIGDESELRYKTQAPLSGTISGSRKLTRGSTYRVSGNVTIASGATLVIPAGTILKFDAGVQMTVNGGGTLLSEGTRAAPVVFTSVKDDEFGGDTNGDGDATIPAPGDWTAVKVAGGRAEFRNTKILYSSRNQTTGAINQNGGTVVFDGGEIAHGLYDAVGVESGNFFMTNAVIRDCLLAFRHWARDPIVNCVIHDCGRLTQGGGQTFVNCVFADIDETWEAFGFPKSTYRNCVFWNEGGSVLTGEGTQDAMTVCGQDGNRWGDPMFRDVDAGDYRIREGSACIDAADSSAAPEKDTFGQKRWDFPAIANADAGAADVGVAECVPRNAASDVDLVPVSAKMSWNRAAVKPGDAPYFFWTVANDGGEDVETDWWDELALVSVSSGRIAVLGEYNQTKGVSAGGTTTGSKYFEIPPLAEGDYRLRLNANSHRSDVPEGSRTENNVLLSDTVVHVEVATEDASVGAAGMAGKGGRIVRKFEVAAGSGAMLAHVTAPAGSVLRYGLGFMPGEGSASGELELDASGRAAFAVPEGADCVYVVLESAADGPFDIVFTDGALAVASVLPAQVPRSGRVTLRVAGAGFADGCAVSLLAPSGAAVVPVRTVRSSAEELWATVDCAALAAAGTRFALRVETSGGDAMLENAVSVTGEEGHSGLWAELDRSDLEMTRRGARITARIHYGNTNNVDILAPILQVAVDGGGELGYVDGRRGFSAIQFVGAGGSGVAGVLRPGEERTISFRFWPGADGSVYLYTSDGQAWFESPWTNLADQLADFSAAATRIALRGQDATDYELVHDLALAVKRGEDPGGFCGMIVDSDGTPIGNAFVVFKSQTGATALAGRSDDTGRFATAIGMSEYSFVEPGEYSIDCDGFPLDPSSTKAVLEPGLDTDLVLKALQTNVVRVLVPNGTDGLRAVSSCIDTADARTGFATKSAFEFRGLTDGSWQFELFDGDNLVFFARTLVENGVPVGRGALEYDGMKPGLLSLETYAMPPDCCLFVFSLESGFSRFVFPDVDAAVIPLVLPAGDYETVLVSAEGETLAFGASAVTSGLTTHLMLSASEGVAMDPAPYEPAGRLTDESPRAAGDSGTLGTRAKRAVDEAHSLLAIPLSQPTGSRDCIHNRDLFEYYSSYRETFHATSLAFETARNQYLDAFTAWNNQHMNACLGAIQEYLKSVLTLGFGTVADISATVLDVALDQLLEGGLSFDSFLEILGLRRDSIGTGSSALGAALTGFELGDAFAKAKILKQQYDVHAMALEMINLPRFEEWIAQFRQFLVDNDNYAYRDCCSNRPDRPNPRFDDWIDSVTPSIPQSVDPNEVTGPVGLGDPETERFVKPGEWLDFTIYFENATNATAAARTVKIVEDVDPRLDWESLTLGEVVFANETDRGLSGLHEGASDYEVPGTNYLVRTTFTVHNGLASWYLRLVDPAGDEDGWPTDKWLANYGGFLPPNDTNHVGEGHVTYRIKVRDDAPKNVRIETSAKITFDSHETIPTDPSWWNTVGHPAVELAFFRNCDDAVLSMPTNGPYACDAPEFGTPVREGWFFLGWADTNGVARNCGADLPYGTDALDLYAQWKEIVEAKFATIAVDGGVLIAGLADGEACPEDLVIPSTLEIGGRRVKVVGVADDAFKGKRAIRTLTVMEGVRTIGARSFMNCTSLESVSLPSSVESIGENAFYGCRLLGSLTIAAETPPALGSGAFRSVAAAGVLRVPEGSETAYAAWIGTDLGSAWTVDGYDPGEPPEPGEPAWTLYADQNRLVYAAGAVDVRWTIDVSVAADGGVTLLRASTTDERGAALVLPDPVLDETGAEHRIVAIGADDDITLEGVFEGLDLGSVSIPESVVSIAPCAFANCAELEDIVFAGDAPALRTVGAGAFFGCTSLRRVWMDTLFNLAELGGADDPLGVFESCWNLSDVVLPCYVDSVGAFAFQDCSRLASVTFDGFDGARIRSIGKRAFYNCDSLADVNWDALVGLEEIGEAAFGGDTAATAPKIVSATFHRDFASLGAGALLNAGSLAEITCFAETPPARGANAFLGVARTGVLRVPAAVAEDYTNQTARAWIGPEEGKLPPWNGTSGWSVEYLDASEELRRREAHLTDEEFAAFLSLADLLGFTEAELCALEHPAEALVPDLRIVAFDKDATTFPVSIRFANGIDETPREAFSRLRAKSQNLMFAVVSDELGGEERRVALQGSFDADGTFRVYLGTAFDKTAPSQFVRIVIRDE